MYTNADCLLNKMCELKCTIETLENKPQIIAITEVNSKLPTNVLVTSELNIPGYDIYHNIEGKGERGVLVYILSVIDASEIYFNTIFKESVFVKLKLNNGNYVTIGNIYRSPNCKKEEDETLCHLIEEVVEVTNHDLLIVGDFNFPDINWDIFHTDSTGSSLMFLDTLQDNLLIQHVDFLTRARGVDEPHLLDLVITSTPCVNKVSELAPL